MRRLSMRSLVAIIGSALWACAAWAQVETQDTTVGPAPGSDVPEVQPPLSPHVIGDQIGAYITAAVLGYYIGRLFSDRMRRFRKYVAYALGAVVVVGSLYVAFPLNAVSSVPIAIVVFFVAIRFGLAWGAEAGERSVTFGSAKWATASLLQQRGMVGEQGLALGYFPARPQAKPLHYSGDRHLLTVAPTRAGKGVSAIIPNLLTYRGSALVIDPRARTP